MPTYSPEIKFVSLGSEPVAAGLYWRAALGELDAHMVHYGESSFATVFTDIVPKIESPRANFLLKGIRSFIGKTEEPYTLSSIAQRTIELEAAEICIARGLDLNELGLTRYLGIMAKDNAIHLAEGFQADLEHQVKEAMAAQ